MRRCYIAPRQQKVGKRCLRGSLLPRGLADGLGTLSGSLKTAYIWLERPLSGFIPEIGGKLSGRRAAVEALATPMETARGPIWTLTLSLCST